MKYTVLIAERDITVSECKKLEAKGAVVPYFCGGENIYFYVPDGFDCDTLKKILDFTETTMSVDSSEVDKHKNKVDSVNKPKVGDIVFCREEYRNLPFKVIEVGDENCIAETKLRGKTIRINKKHREVEVTTDYFEYEVKLPAERKIKLFVDCDCLIDRSGDVISYMNALILLLMRIKQQYEGMSLVICNPDIAALKIAQLTGVMVGIGNIEDMVRHYVGSYLFSNVKYTNTKRIFIDKENYIAEIQPIENKENNKEDFQIYTNISTIDEMKLQEMLVSVGLYYLASNTPMVISTLHS